MKKLLTYAAMLVALPSMLLAAPHIGEMAPSIKTTDINGEMFDLSAHVGSPVVLEWSNHECPFVVKYHKNGDMQKLQKDYTAKGVKWVRVISSAPDKQGHVTPDEAKKIIADNGIAATTTLLDESGEIGKAYDAKTTPHMFVIDKEGKLAYEGAIDSIRSASADDIAKATPFVSNALDSILAGESVEVSSSQPYGCGIKY